MQNKTIWQCHNPECNAQYSEYVNGCPKCSTGEPGGSHKVSVLDECHPGYVKLFELFNPDLLKVMQGAEESKEDDLKKVKEELDSDARQTPPSFDEMVGLIKKLFTDYLEDVVKSKPSEIAKSWERYKVLNHLYQNERVCQTGPRWVMANERLPEPFKVVPCKYTPDSPDPRKDTELHWGFVSKEGVWSRLWQNHQVEWLDETA